MCIQINCCFKFSVLGSDSGSRDIGKVCKLNIATLRIVAAKILESSILLKRKYLYLNRL